MPEPVPANTLIAGRYMLYGEIAAGGMATVHIGRQVGTAGFSRTVAIKRLLPEFARDPEFVAMMVDEARMVARIRHPNVVPTLDCVAAEGQLLLVMEYIQGESLGRLTKSARIRAELAPPRIASAILSGALHGLHAAHEATDDHGMPLQIVHRDVSPQNILVGTDGVARVIDFGVAKASGRVQSTREGKVKGKFAYMAPEQLGSAGVTRQTDVYAAAVVLWETLTGTRLFEGETEAVVLGKVLQGNVALPSRTAPGISPALDAVVMRGLAHDLTTRFASAREMAVALEAACPPATASEVGAWVEKTGGPALTRRAKGVAEIERASSMSAPAAHEILSRLDAQSSRPPPPGETEAASTQYAATFVPPLPPAPGLQFAATQPGSVPGVSPPPRGGFMKAALFGVVLAAVAVCAFVLLSAGAREALLSGPVAASSGNPTGTAGGAASGTASAAGVAAVSPSGCPDGMARIPGGKFYMGSDDDLPTERPAHQVTLAPYCIDVFEVTTEAYKACSDQGECKRAGRNNEWDGITAHERQAFDVLCNVRDPAARATHPINCIDWTMAQAFCRAHGRRLPTEAEWEFAARGSDGRKYPWGDEEPTPSRLNACGKECVQWGLDNGVEESAMYAADDHWPTTAPVGSFPAGKSRFGIFDAVGNVWEWVADWYAPYTSGEQPDPKGPATGSARVIRGGAWNGAQPSWVRPTFRYHDAPDKRSYGIGFRCAQSS